MPAFHRLTLERSPGGETALRDKPLPQAVTDNRFEDSEVARVCQQKLSESPFASVQQIVCHFHEGLLTLRGTVPTYYAKQMAYAAICDVPGAESFVDRIEVIARDSVSVA